MSVPREANLFDASIQSRIPAQVSLTNVIRRMIRENNRSLRVCLPGKIVNIDNSFQVDVQPLLQSQYNASPAPVTLPVLPNVPVSMPNGADFSVVFPLQAGDCGLLIFADRSLDSWLAGNGDLADPQDARLHDITDAIFVPGLLTTAQGTQKTDGTTDLVVQNGAGHVRVKKNGHVAIGNAQADLAAQLKSLADKVAVIAGTLANTPTAPGKAVDPTMSLTQSEIEEISAALNTIAS